MLCGDMSQTITISFVLCLSLLACSASDKESRKFSDLTSSKLASGAPTRVQFAWPVPSVVTIEEMTQKTGAPTTRIRYKLDVKRGSDDVLHLSTRDFELLGLGEFDVSDPALAAQMNQAREQLALRPKFSVDADGRFVDILEREALIEAVLRMGAARDGRTPEETERVRQAFNQPVFAKQLRNLAVNPWQAWVGLWISTQLPAPGATRVVPAVASSGKRTIINHGPIADAPGHVKLSYEQKVDLREQMAEIKAATTPPADGSKMPDVESAWQRFESEVEIEVATGRPRRAKTRAVKYSKFEGIEARTTEELTEYRFTW